RHVRTTRCTRTAPVGDRRADRRTERICIWHTMTSIISIRDVTFTYALANAPALQNVTLDIPAGQICGGVGRIAAGKSTLCALCAGFIPNFYNGQISGSALIDDQDVIQQTV